MSYPEFQRECARYGFAHTPLTERQFARAIREAGADNAYAIACDVAAGFSLKAAIAANR